MTFVRRLALVLPLALSLAACGSASVPHITHTNRQSRTPPPGPAPAHFLQVDSAAHTATVTLIASYDGANNGFNFDGYSRELMWTVPRGWTVRVICKNHGTLRHSCAVVSNSIATTPAFRGASTPHPQLGLAPGKKATFSFRASKAGSYRFACLVPGHEDARMWDVLKIVPRGKPSVVDLQAK